MRKFEISVYVLAPLIFGLLSIFSFVVSFQIIDYCLDRQRSPDLFLGIAGALVSFGSAFIAYVIIRFVLTPAEHFMEEARRSSSLSASKDDREKDDQAVNQKEDRSRTFDPVGQPLDLQDAQHLFPEVIGNSRTMRQVFSQIVKVASTDATVLILGESGTGKELIAESIVAMGHRKDKPLVRINCAAITPTLMESELFGHEKGAFTGAVSQKKGCFEQADQGTLFLDEIGDMPRELQVKLLRVLQERSFLRVGGDTPLEVDVRIVAATNKKLESMVADGNFREDLFYRINVFPLFLPPLRERQGDVERLADHFLALAAPGKSFDSTAMDLMKNHAWPGNVRELENIVERAAVLADASMVVLPEHIPAMLKSPENLAHPFQRTAKRNGTLSLDETLKNIETGLICDALKQTHGVQVRAAKKLGISQRSLWNRVKKYGIDVNTFKVDA